MTAMKLLLPFSISTLFCFSADSSWIDSQTPEAARKDPSTGYDLVFSDEFNDPGRSFGDSHDTRWTAEDRPAVVNAALHYYNSSNVYTKADGTLAIATKRQISRWTEYDSEGNPFYFQRPYQSGMVTTWNKFCFTGGVIEISFRLPGRSTRGGMWPAFWMLGNLVRPNYLESSNGLWPWSYDTCGVTAEAKEAAEAQKLDACTVPRGRGSPEIDIIEAQAGDYVLNYYDLPFVDGSRRDVPLGRPQISSSLQVAPGVKEDRRVYSPNFPLTDGTDWYPGLFPFGGDAYGGIDATQSPRMLNNYWYGQLINEDPRVWQDGMSVTWQHPESYYTEQTVMRTEWEPGKYVRWFNGEGQLMLEITQDMLNARPGAADAIPRIPYEAMYLILNTDVSPRWGWNGCNPQAQCSLENPGFCNAEYQLTCTDCGNPDCLICPEQSGWLADFCQDIQPESPAEYLIDYVRVYQNPRDSLHTLSCNPRGLETKPYIDAHWEKYTFNSYVNKEPLRDVQFGGGACVRDEDCRGNSQQEGNCIDGTCSCPIGWTGPKCHSPCLGDYAKTCIPESERSASPSENPSGSPSSIPSSIPTSTASLDPTGNPSSVVSSSPTARPSSVPSSSPTARPSSVHSDTPSAASAFPSAWPVTSSASPMPSPSPTDSSSTESPTSESKTSQAPSTQGETRDSTTSSAPSTAPSTDPTQEPSSSPLLPPVPVDRGGTAAGIASSESGMLQVWTGIMVSFLFFLALL